MVLPAPGDRRHYGNIITIADRGCFLLQVTHVLVIQINIYEGAKLALVGVKVAAKVGMARHQAGKRLANVACLHLHRGLLPGILAKRGGDVDFGHRLYMMPHPRLKIHHGSDFGLGVQRFWTEL